MDAPRRASRYDLFKLIVALFLLLLFFLLLSRPTDEPLSPAPTIVSQTESSPAAASSTAGTSSVAIRATSTSLPPAADTSLPQTSPTQTAEPAASTSLPTQTATLPVEAMATVSSPTPTIASPSTPTPDTSVAVNACEAAESRSRLQVGNRATIVRRLNFRSSPGIGDNWLLTNIPGTQVELVGGPECLPHILGAYVWWQIRLPNGEIGWSAEGSMHGTFYFMEPAL